MWKENRAPGGNTCKQREHANLWGKKEIKKRTEKRVLHGFIDGPLDNYRFLAITKLSPLENFMTHSVRVIYWTFLHQGTVEGWNDKNGFQPGLLFTETWWSFDLKMQCRRVNIKALPPPTASNSHQLCGKIRCFTVLVLFSLTGQALDRQWGICISKRKRGEMLIKAV